MTQPATLDELLQSRDGSSRAVVYINGSDSERRLAYSSLLRRAVGLLHHLQSAGAAAGSEVVLLTQSNEELVDAFWACMLGAMVAVPVAPGPADEHRAHLYRLLERLRQPYLCTEARLFANLEAFARDHGLEQRLDALRPRTVLVDRITDLSRPGRLCSAAPDDLALVQFSSGSTSAPKGVMLSHRNLLSNMAAIVRAARIGADDSTLSWMPLTHDMGLIGFHLVPVFADIDQYLMPTALFARRPMLWLHKASEKQASLLSSPNFGYRLLLRAFEREAPDGVDLSRVRLLFNGAEPISTALAREFLDKLAGLRLRPEAMYPVYGLAEASLAVAFPEAERGMSCMWVRREALRVGARADVVDAGCADAVEFAQEGRPVPECEVRVTGDDGQRLPQGYVGHVQILGRNVTRGYYADPEQTRAVMTADGWLDTGDLGFLWEATLTITGRVKDVLFVNGQNFYPHDVETLVERHAGIEVGRVAAVGVRTHEAATDDVVLFLQHQGDLSAFLPRARAARAAIGEQLNLDVSRVLPVARIPKTTSGKMQRYLLAEAFLRGEFDETLRALSALDNAHAEAPVTSELEQTLLEICGAYLGDRRVSLQDNFFELGTSSLTLAQIYERIDSVYPGQLEITDFFDYPTIQQLAGFLAAKLQPAHA